jgi:cell division protein FtsN
VQLGVFGEEANARRMAQRSSTFGYKADVSSYRANGRTLYRVRVGSATSRGQADATASALRAHGLTEVRVLAAEP